MTAMTLSNANLALVNHMRIAAQRSAEDFDILKFFADAEYARACVARLVRSSVPELSALATRAGQALPPAATPRPQATPTSSAATVVAGAQARSRSAGAAEFGAGPAAGDPCFEAAQQLMRRAATEAAGPRAAPFLRLLDGARNREQLLALAEPFYILMTRQAGSLVAFTTTQRATRMLGLEP